MQNGESLGIVLETIDTTEVAIVKSLLEGAGIPYLTRVEDQYDAFRGAFRGTVFNPHGRPVVFLVPATMAEEARLLLQPGELTDESLMGRDVSCIPPTLDACALDAAGRRAIVNAVSMPTTNPSPVGSSPS